VDEITSCFLRLVGLVQEATDVIRIREEQQKAASAPYVLSNIGGATIPTLADLQRASALLRVERERILRSITPSELFVSGSFSSSGFVYRLLLFCAIFPKTVARPASDPNFPTSYQQSG